MCVPLFDARARTAASRGGKQAPVASERARLPDAKHVIGGMTSVSLLRPVRFVCLRLNDARPRLLFSLSCSTENDRSTLSSPAPTSRRFVARRLGGDDPASERQTSRLTNRSTDQPAD